jgi:uncharacterized protein
MATIYVVSPEAFTGKSALCVGLGLHWSGAGRSVGYLKPVSMRAGRVDGVCLDEDAEFLKQVLSLQEPLRSLTPICLDSPDIEEILRGEQRDWAHLLRASYDRAAAGKDIVLLEGGGSLTDGAIIGLPVPEVASLLGARELLIVKHNARTVADDILGAKAFLGPAMFGAVINMVPRADMELMAQTVVPFLQAHGVQVFGLLPQERALSSISVRELARVLGGEILCCMERADELVENLMVGAMSVDAALSYFRRKPNKAVITGGDRPDIQLAALETSTRSLILTGNLQPSPIIMGRAEELGVPIILVHKDTLTTVETIEQYFGRTRFHQEKKIQRFEQLLASHLDWTMLEEAISK